jgi:hypothetical protein
MKSRILNLALLGFIVGAVIAEFFPNAISSGFKQDMGASFSEPFDRYRNKLALRYGLSGAAIGAVLGLLARGEKR